MTQAARKNRIITLEGFIVDGDTQTPASPELIALCVDLWEMKKDGDDVKVELDTLKKEVLEGFEGISPSASILIPGYCRISLKKGASKWTIKDVAVVREKLGARFADLIEEKITYAPTPKLIAMIADGDDETGKALRKYLKLTIGDPTVAIAAA